MHLLTFLWTCQIEVLQLSKFKISHWHDNGWSGVVYRGEDGWECLVWHSGNEGCGSVFIFSGSGSSILGWTPIRIRIQGFNDQKLRKKITADIFFYFFMIKTAIYLSLGLHKVFPSYRRSLQLSKEAIQHFKTWTFTNFCLLLWVIFALLDPDPQTRLNLDPDPDPDPQPCW